ncbi:MAG: beta strand repeat-containing protein [Opitutaceae bacterium]
MKPRPPTQSLFTLSLIAVAAGMPLIGNAQTTYTWDGSDSITWSTGTNWVGDAAPVATGTLDFSGTAIVNQPTDNDIAAATSFNGITFTNDGSVGVSDQAFTLDGNSITLGGDITTTTTVVDTLEDTIDLDLILDADRSIIPNTGHALTINGDISGAFNLALGVNNATGKALVTLSGNNTHTLTALNRNASVRVESNTALGGAANMARNASIDLANGVDLTAAGGITRVVTGTPQQSINLDETGIASASINASTGITNNLGGQYMKLIVGDEDTLTINGAISGVGDTRKQGLGTLVLTNAGNDYTGIFRVNLGALAISGAGVLGDTTSVLFLDGGSLDLGTTSQTVATLNIQDSAASGDTIFNGTISANGDDSVLGSEIPGAINASNGNDVTVSANLGGVANPGGAVDLTKTGAGVLTLSGTNTYTGTTTSSAGSLVATSAAAFPGYTTPGNIIFNGGTIGVQVAGAGWTPTELSDLLSNATKTSGGLGIDTTNGDFTPSAAFTPATLGALGLTKLGANSLTFELANTYTGNTTLTEGTLNINHASALGDAASSFFIAAGTTIDNTSGGPITLTNNNAITLPKEGFTFGGASDLDLGTGAINLQLADSGQTNVITLNGTGSTLTLGASTSGARGFNVSSAVNGAGNTLVFASLGLNARGVGSDNTWSGDADITVNGAVSDGASGANTLIYSGTGTFTIGGAATYTGNTDVNSGTLALGAGGSLYDETRVTLNAGLIELNNTVSDTIRILIVIGVNADAALPNGVYGSTASGADNGGLGVGALDGYLTGTGTFTVFIPPYEAWATNAVFENDANDDGVSNGLAWILGAANITDSALPLLPDSAVSTGDLVMTFTMVDPIAPATLSLEYSNDLTGAWTSVTVPTVTSTVGDVDFVIVDNTGTLTVTATIDSTAASASGELFGRLSATEN